MMSKIVRHLKQGGKVVFEPETKELSSALYDCATAIGKLHPDSGIIIEAAAERLDAQTVVINGQATEIEALRAALTEISEWTDRYTSHGHPISTVAKRALTGQ